MLKTTRITVDSTTDDILAEIQRIVSDVPSDETHNQTLVRLSEAAACLNQLLYRICPGLGTQSVLLFLAASCVKTLHACISSPRFAEEVSELCVQATVVGRINGKLSAEAYLSNEADETDESLPTISAPMFGAREPGKA